MPSLPYRPRPAPQPQRPRPAAPVAPIAPIATEPVSSPNLGETDRALHAEMPDVAMPLSRPVSAKRSQPKPSAEPVRRGFGTDTISIRQWTMPVDQVEKVMFQGGDS